MSRRSRPRRRKAKSRQRSPSKWHARTQPPWRSLQTRRCLRNGAASCGVRVGRSPLVRAFATQVEVLRRLRNGGQQFVRVEHVHVNDGGQAVIGNVKKSDISTIRKRRDRQSIPKAGFSPAIWGASTSTDIAAFKVGART